MGLSGADKKELDSLIKAASSDPKIPVGLAHRLVPGQGDIEEFAYGLSSGMVIGNFIASFRARNGRELDRDEIADLFAVVMSRMPKLRGAIRKHLDLR